MTVQYSPVSVQTAEPSDVMKNIYKQRRKRTNKGKPMFDFNGSQNRMSLAIKQYGSNAILNSYTSFI